jgi:hypothetical protein
MQSPEVIAAVVRDSKRALDILNIPVDKVDELFERMAAIHEKSQQAQAGEAPVGATHYELYKLWVWIGTILPTTVKYSCVLDTTTNPFRPMVLVKSKAKPPKAGVNRVRAVLPIPEGEVEAICNTGMYVLEQLPPHAAHYAWVECAKILPKLRNGWDNAAWHLYLQPNAPCFVLVGTDEDPEGD